MGQINMTERNTHAAVIIWIIIVAQLLPGKTEIKSHKTYPKADTE